MRIRDIGTLTGLALIVVLAATPARAGDGGGLAWSAIAGAGYDTNIGNSGSSDDERDVATAEAGIGASWEHPFGLFTALQLRYGLAAEQVFGLEDLSSARATMRVRMRYKPGAGFHVPVLAAWASMGGRDYGSAIRDSYDYRAGLSLAEQLTTTVQLRAEAAEAKRDSGGRVHDLRGTSWSVNLDWTVSPRVTLYAGVGGDDSPIVVSADGHGDIAPKSQHIYLELAADAVEEDTAFGEDWWAFRIDGRTTFLTAGVNVPLSPMMSLDFQVRRAEASYQDHSYERLLGNASLLLRW